MTFDWKLFHEFHSSAKNEISKRNRRSLRRLKKNEKEVNEHSPTTRFDFFVSSTVNRRLISAELNGSVPNLFTYSWTINIDRVTVVVSFWRLSKRLFDFDRLVFAKEKKTLQPLRPLLSISPSSSFLLTCFQNYSPDFGHIKFRLRNNWQKYFCLLMFRKYFVKNVTIYEISSKNILKQYSFSRYAPSPSFMSLCSPITKIA